MVDDSCLYKLPSYIRCITTGGELASYCICMSFLRVTGAASSLACFFALDGDRCSRSRTGVSASLSSVTHLCNLNSSINPSYTANLSAAFCETIVLIRTSRVTIAYRIYNHGVLPRLLHVLHFNRLRSTLTEYRMTFFVALSLSLSIEYKSANEHTSCMIIRTTDDYTTLTWQRVCVIIRASAASHRNH